MKFKIPFSVSFNIGDDVLVGNPKLQFSLENYIYQIIEEIIA